MKYPTYMGGLLLVATLLSGCQQDNEPAPAAMVPAVSYIEVTTSEYPIVSEMQGRVTASLSAEVRPQVTGIVKSREFAEGDQVEAGQLLYQIDPATYQAAYNEAKANLKSAQSVVESTRLKDERYQSLLEIEGISKQDADDAHADYLSAVADVEKYRAALESARIDLEYTRIKAPISGRIGISSVTPGALVTAEQDSALATIRTLDPIYVDMTKSSKELLKLRRMLEANGVEKSVAEVSLLLEDGTEYDQTGQLKMQEIAVDESTGSVTLRAEFPNPDGLLLPGMFVRTQVHEGVDKNAILVPQQGVYQASSGGMYAYVIGADNRIEKRNLETAAAAGNQWLVTSGLSIHDHLLVEGSGKVGPGSEVNPVQVQIDSQGAVVELSSSTGDGASTADDAATQGGA